MDLCPCAHWVSVELRLTTMFFEGVKFTKVFFSIVQVAVYPNRNKFWITILRVHSTRIPAGPSSPSHPSSTSSASAVLPCALGTFLWNAFGQVHLYKACSRCPRVDPFRLNRGSLQPYCALSKFDPT